MAYDAQWLYQTIKTDPQGSEAKSLGDDAIREIKVVLQNMFKGSFDSGTTDQYIRTFPVKQPWSDKGFSLYVTSGGASCIIDMTMVYEVV